MGAAFGSELPASGASAVWRIPSRWFYQDDSEFANLVRMADIRALAERVARGQVLRELSLRACDLVCFDGENFLRRQTTKGRRLMLLEMVEPELVEIVREVLPLMDEVHVREKSSLRRMAGRD